MSNPVRILTGEQEVKSRRVESLKSCVTGGFEAELKDSAASKLSRRRPEVERNGGTQRACDGVEGTQEFSMFRAQTQATSCVSGLMEDPTE